MGVVSWGPKPNEHFKPLLDLGARWPFRFETTDGGFRSEVAVKNRLEFKRL
jgi:hypothetical protein